MPGQSNPLQQQHHLQLWHPDILHKLQTVVPGLASAVRAVWSLPAQLAAALDLQLPLLLCQVDPPLLGRDTHRRQLSLLETPRNNTASAIPSPLTGILTG